MICKLYEHTALQNPYLILLCKSLEIINDAILGPYLFDMCTLTLFAAIVLEFCVKVLTALLPCPLKGLFYHSALVLLVSAIIARYKI